MVVSIYIPTNSASVPFSPHPLQHLLFVDFLMMVILTGVTTTISHYSFDLHFSNNEWCQASFHVFISHLYVFFEKYLVRSLAQFFSGLLVFLELSCMSYLYILEINSCQLLHLLLFSPILKAVFSPCL